VPPGASLEGCDLLDLALLGDAGIVLFHHGHRFLAKIRIGPLAKSGRLQNIDSWSFRAVCNLLARHSYVPEVAGGSVAAGAWSLEPFLEMSASLADPERRRLDALICGHVLLALVDLSDDVVGSWPRGDHLSGDWRFEAVVGRAPSGSLRALPLGVMVVGADLVEAKFMVVGSRRREVIFNSGAHWIAEF